MGTTWKVHSRRSTRATSAAPDHEFLLRVDLFTKDAIHEWLYYKPTKELNPIRMRPTPHEFFLYYDI